MIKTGKEILSKELYELQSKKRQVALQRIKNACKFCDFREDSEYEAALISQAQIEVRSLLLLDRLRHAEVTSVPDDETDPVVFGAPVTFIKLPDGDEEVDLVNGTISNEFHLPITY
ncbi:hypothetical protein [Sporosarcina ureae]|uniref:Transcription elongation factor GreA/GreB N-terminal domain-containing protein n=1 Tax=Sporosarcina ureae TaxID=1571 RepID=A0ABM6JS36_SPOUR|nr:hypothetical protein [Sporosarcina ureae]ARF12946.1 hypothetical protein SporoS204_01390 [Sporosarcina ureae]